MNYSNFEGLPKALHPDYGSPDWNNKGDKGWQLTAATLVCLQSVPGLVILYGGMVKKKWAVNSAFMVLYAFAAVLVCWVLWAHHMSFRAKLISIVGRPKVALAEKFILAQYTLGYVPMADCVYYQFAFAAIAVILLAGSLLGRMNFNAWMLFVPLRLTLCYTTGAFTIWGNGFLEPYIIDYADGFVIHLSSGVAGFTAAYWVGPRHSHDRQHFPPNNIIQMLGGAGFLWLGWTGFNGGSPFSVNEIASLAILNTHLCTATSLLVWVSMDMIVHVQEKLCNWCSPGNDHWTRLHHTGSRNCVSMGSATNGNIAVAGTLGGILSGIFAKPNLLTLMYGQKYGPGLIYSFSDGEVGKGLRQIGYQLAGAVFVTAWNAGMTSLICILISRIVRLRMNEDDLESGDDAEHGEEAYALWGDGDNTPTSRRWLISPRIPSICGRNV